MCIRDRFRTPRHIIRMMVEMMNPKANEIICDPACGTSGFLVAASEYLRDRKKQEVLFDRQNKEHYMNHMFHVYDTVSYTHLREVITILLRIEKCSSPIGDGNRNKG